MSNDLSDIVVSSRNIPGSSRCRLCFVRCPRNGKLFICFSRRYGKKRIIINRSKYKATPLLILRQAIISLVVLADNYFAR